MYFYFICLWPGTVPTEGDEFKVLIPDIQAMCFQHVLKTNADCYLIKIPITTQCGDCCLCK